MDAAGNTPSDVVLYTDGACLGNPGPGGWAYILYHPASGRCAEASGGERRTTNNRMEITAVIRGLEALRKPCRVRLCTDSQYVARAIAEWMPKWRKHGWRRSAGAVSQVKNAELWQRLDELLQKHQVTPMWLRGHSGDPRNERCDEMARREAERAAGLEPAAESATDDANCKPRASQRREDRR